MSDKAPDYHPFYCEENIWWLNRSARFQDAPRDVVFITSQGASCPLFGMRAAGGPEEPIFWDYHVVLLDRCQDEPLIWDLDSIHGAPLDARLWFSRTIPDWNRLPQAHRPLFRLVSGPDFERGFSSDRSHMHDLEGNFYKPPPPWDPPCQDAVGMVLDHYRSAQEGGPGELITAAKFLRRIS